MDIQETRRHRFRLVGNALVESLQLSSIDSVDTDSQGKASDKLFREWLNRQMPTRFQSFFGTVLSAVDPPSAERDCLVYDVGEAPVFRGGHNSPDMFAAEGVLGAIEINTGRAGTTYEKLAHDCDKLTGIGETLSHSLAHRARAVRLTPISVPGTDTISKDLAVLQQPFRLPPILYLFIETLKGSLAELANRIARHNKQSTVSSSVSGAFVVNSGFILHIDPGNGWNTTRLPAFPIAYMQAEPWEVLLKLMTVIWNRIALETSRSLDLGPYYADQKYFAEIEEPRITILSDPDYLSQKDPGIAMVRG